MLSVKQGRTKCHFLRVWYCCILTSDPAKHAIPKTAEVAHSDDSYGKKSRRRASLTIWDKVKSRGTVTDWCTWREWPVNCMTVISARWQSNMPFQGQRKWHIPTASYGEILSGRLNYYITRWRQEVSEFGDQTRWGQDRGRESQHPTLYSLDQWPCLLINKIIKITWLSCHLQEFVGDKFATSHRPERK